MYIHVFYLKTKLYDKITVFKTNVQHKQDKAYITYICIIIEITEILQRSITRVPN